jgi:hypothetical protein
MDLLSPGFRRALIEQINSDENKRRKAESLKRFEIYHDRGDRYVVEKLLNEFEVTTVKEMRKCMSINLAKRVVDSEASVYGTEPERTFEGLNEVQTQLIMDIYDDGKFNHKLKLANRYYKLEDQCAIQVIPQDGEIKLRVLLPHHYDVVPDPMNPEKAYAYIVSTFNRGDYMQDNSSVRSPIGEDLASQVIDRQNQDIADGDDYQGSMNMYEVWTKDLNFFMDQDGNILSTETLNELQELPFIDVACDKDFEFFIRHGNSTTDFSIDLNVLLSDIWNINRIQGYAQGIISSEQPPSGQVVGPNRYMWLQIDPNKPVQPSFQFQNPNPDLASSLELLEMSIRLFLTSKGLDPKVLSGKGDGQNIQSGIQLLLSMIQKFEATKDDFDLFRWVEYEIAELVAKWVNVLQGSQVLETEYQGVLLPEEIDVSVKFHEPQLIQTKQEKEDSLIKLMDKGLISKTKVLAELHGVSDDQAKKMMEEIDKENVLTAPKIQFDNENMDDVDETTEIQ